VKIKNKTSGPNTEEGDYIECDICIDFSMVVFMIYLFLLIQKRKNEVRSKLGGSALLQRRKSTWQDQMMKNSC